VSTTDYAFAETFVTDLTTGRHVEAGFARVAVQSEKDLQ